MSDGMERCLFCSKHRKSLRAMASRFPRDERTHPSSHTPYAILNTPEKDERLRRLRLDNKRSKLHIDRLREKLEVAASKANVTVDDTLDADIRSMASDSTELVNGTYPENSFQHIFWEQQCKAASLKDSRAMRWHPLCIKWCLYLRHLSGKAYYMLRYSGCVQLPSQRTLRDYTHYTSTTIGFSVDVDRQLRDAIDFSKERNRYMYIHVHACM